MAKFMVAISYREGVVLCEQYDKLDGHYFKDLDREFGNMFEKANKGDSKLWIQDGDPSQNCALARCSWLALGAEPKNNKKKRKMANEKQTNPKIMPNKNKEITAKLQDLLDLRVSVHGRGRNCCARDLTGSALLPMYCIWKVLF